MHRSTAADFVHYFAAAFLMTLTSSSCREKNEVRLAPVCFPHEHAAVTLHVNPDVPPAFANL